jgi:hypothetical protein
MLSSPDIRRGETAKWSVKVSPSKSEHHTISDFDDCGMKVSMGIIGL